MNRTKTFPPDPSVTTGLLVWEAVLRLPPEPQLLVRGLLTKLDRQGREYEWPENEVHRKASSHVAQLAEHMRVHPRTVRRMIDDVLQNPAFKRKLMAALRIEVDVSGRSWNDPGDVTFARAWSTDDGGRNPVGDREPSRSRHDYTRGNWEWSGREARACRLGVPLVPYSGREGPWQGALRPAGGPGHRGQGTGGRTGGALAEAYLPAPPYRRNAAQPPTPLAVWLARMMAYRAPELGGGLASYRDNRLDPNRVKSRPTAEDTDRDIALGRFMTGRPGAYRAPTDWFGQPDRVPGPWPFV